MTEPTPARRRFNAEGHVKAIGGLQIVFSLLLLIAATAIFAGGGYGAQAIRDEGNEPELADMVASFVRVLAFVFFALAAIGIVGAVGLFLHEGWGRAMSFVTAAVLLLGLPFGTAFGIYSLVVLSRPETAELFQAAPRGTPA